VGFFGSLDIFSFLNLTSELNLKQWAGLETQQSQGIHHLSQGTYSYSSRRAWNISGLNAPVSLNFSFPLLKQRFFIGTGTSFNFFLSGKESNSSEYSLVNTEVTNAEDRLFDDRGYASLQRFATFGIVDIGMRFGNRFEVVLRHERKLYPLSTEEKFYDWYTCGTLNTRVYDLRATSLGIRYFIP